ncbi:hypothetical protein [Citrobacter werkmanii]|uniref:hypothetical protein n=1 Tax=Citrobacter werkmanii TaxID=67827 RepID=UPI0015766AC5|nr:hypothetical protein [Citrobacter werkmanii]NTY83110.1 hypothetical protein [Citrobacter werkmanii]HCJ7769761.1 hypothetical protein [Citrobacter freundii]
MGNEAKNLRTADSIEVLMLLTIDMSPSSIEPLAQKILDAIDDLNELQERRNADAGPCKYCGGTGYFRWKKSANTFPCPCMGCDPSEAPQQELKSALEIGMSRYAGAMQKLAERDK